MAAIIKDNQVFIKYNGRNIPVNAPEGTLTWNFTYNEIWFAIEDRIIVKSFSGDIKQEIMMNNVGIVSIVVIICAYWRSNHTYIIRFFKIKLLLVHVPMKIKLLLVHISMKKQ